MKHMELDLEVSFDGREIRGHVLHHLHQPAESTGSLTLHTRDLTIESVEVGTADAMQASRFELGPHHPIEGTPLVVPVPEGCDRVAVRYRSAPTASALQWLDPPQTAGRKHPYLYTQGQSIHTRSWIPCIDDPVLRITYEATVRVPPNLRAVMAAEEVSADPQTGTYHYRMPQPIPTYLVALAVGDLEFRALGPRCGVWSEPSVVDRAAAELEDTEAMIQATERLFGEYRWGRYDLLVLPPSFPLGGMENPRLTFATPTILAGDKSLVALVAHELAHSWSGNLVTNATWNDFWLNEGFTVYIERRIQEALYGRERSEMEALIGRAHLQDTLEELGEDSRDTWLCLDLAGRDPDEALTNIPYEKGYLFLRLLEEKFGRERFDIFLRDYFDAYAFRSMTSQEFVRILDEELFTHDPEVAASIDVQAWVFGPGLPANAPQPSSPAFDEAELMADAWLDGHDKLESGVMRAWTAHEWIHFLRCLPRDLSHARMRDLDGRFSLTQSPNCEVLCEWLLLSVASGYEPGLRVVPDFLMEVGRKKFLQPIYQEMMNRESLRDQALAIYQNARARYHPMAQTALDKVMKISS